MKSFRKLRWLLLIPVFGFTFFIIYFYIINRKNTKITSTQNVLFWVSCILIFIITNIIFAIILGIVGSHIHIPDNSYDNIMYVAQFLSMYLLNIPCYIFFKKVNSKIIEQGSLNDTIDLCTVENNDNNQLNVNNPEKTKQIIRWLLLIPVFGFIFFIFYFYIKNRNNTKITRNQNLLFWISCWLTFMITYTVFALFIAIVDSYINMSVNILEIILCVAFFLSIYILNVNCYIFFKKVNGKIVEQDSLNKTINLRTVENNDNNHFNDNIFEKTEQTLIDNTVNQENICELKVDEENKF